MTIRLENNDFEVVGIVVTNNETQRRVQAFASEWLSSLRKKYTDYEHQSVKQVRCDLKQMAITIGTATFGKSFK